MNLRKIFLIAGIILGITFITFVVVLSVTYNQVQGDKVALHEETLNKAISETPLVGSNSYSLFNGRHSYVVIEGIDDDERSLYAFVPYDLEEEGEENLPEVNYVYQEEGLNEDEMLEKWSSNCEQCKLDEMNLGIVNNRVVWEMIYERNQRLYFQTYRFDNGELYDSISFRK
ncbi:cell wall elongation regulator TseB-like domain-containing protein [Piscibacillus sp. B03]|uniref:cell wall elongation regulator TseB-like domain-containing protein n=1 Tax=Piscibacillus sp. B03 TaxID=3457430 RepID=UPI003FCDE90D